MPVRRWNRKRKQQDRSPVGDEALEIDLAGAIGDLPEGLTARPRKRPERAAVPPEELMFAARSVV